MDERRSRWPPARTVIGWMLAIGLAQVLSKIQPPAGETVWAGLIWLSPGVGASALLLAQRRHWPVLVGAFWLACSVVQLSFGKSLGHAVIGPVNNLVEILLVAWMLWPDRDWVDGRSDRLRSWLRFGTWGLIVAPMAGAVIGVLLLVPLTRPAPVLGQTLLTWYTTDVLSLSVIVPLILRLRPRGLRQLRGGGLLRQAVVLVGLVGMALSIFSGEWFLALFLVPLPLVLLLFRSGFAGLSVGTAVQAVIALALTGAGYGPFHAVPGHDPRWALLSCQVFLICVFWLMVMIAALLDERQRLTVMETASFDIYELVGKLSGDLVIVQEPGGWLLYCTPTVGELLGVEAAAMRGHGWLELVHPDDAHVARQLVDDVGRTGQVSSSFRMRHADGSWRWLAVQLRRSGGGAALDHLVVGLVRDITDQRRAAETLQTRADEMFSMAHTDQLTGLPNRRRVSEVYRQASRDAARRREPLALLMIDVDRFKAYNDRYGHPAGDECLSAVAAAMTGALDRPADTCGRYGGEEFVVVLPNTDGDGARHVAERIRAAVEALERPHAGSAVGVVTVSIGAAVRVPPADAPDSCTELFRAADGALYRAKAAGRNTVLGAPLEQ